jgi:hypothetical protein
VADGEDKRLFQVFVTSKDGPAVVVAVNLWADAVTAPPAMADDKTVRAITPETFSEEQFNEDVDALIRQLLILKQEASGIFVAYGRRQKR